MKEPIIMKSRILFYSLLLLISNCSAMEQEIKKAKLFTAENIMPQAHELIGTLVVESNEGNIAIPIFDDSTFQMTAVENTTAGEPTTTIKVTNTLYGSFIRTIKNVYHFSFTPNR